MTCTGNPYPLEWSRENHLMNDYGIDVPDQEVEASQLRSGWEAGDPYEGQFDIPDFVQNLLAEMDTLDEACQKLYQELYPYNLSGKPVPPVSMLDQIRLRQAIDHIEDEKNRVRNAIAEAEWLLPPLLEPPHNMPTQDKARKMLHEGTANGQPLSKAQRGLFGVIASGRRPRRMKAN
jgi:hypothetical protein